MAVTEENGDRDAAEPMPGDAEKFMGTICQITPKQLGEISGWVALVRDLNFPDIYWEYHTAVTSKSGKFLKFVSQVLSEPLRKDALLDLLSVNGGLMGDVMDMVSDAEESLEESSSAVTASGGQLQWAGQWEASEDNPCPICLGEVNNAACVALCFHHFCFGCIQRWAVIRAVCPLCRRPFDCVLRVLPADDKEEEDRVGSPVCHQRNMARERSQSRSSWRHYVLARCAMNNRIPTRWRRPVRSD